jgi:hypothetical protein
MVEERPGGTNMLKDTTALLAVMGLVAVPAGIAGEPEEEFTTEFRLEECKFSDRGGNPFFSLEPGHRLVLEGEDEGEDLLLEITALKENRWVVFETASGETLRVKTRVVEEREWVDDELVEVSFNFFARCKETNDIFYFGEETFEDGELADDSWIAGVDDALPGLIMPGTFLLGARYFQEMAPGVALDRAEHIAMGLTVEVPADTFEGCVEVLDTNALEPGSEGDVKIYCPGVGIVVDGDAELVEFEDGGEAAQLSATDPGDLLQINRRIRRAMIP